jgi:predicted transposase/invertase (TIGR01784 family)
MALNAMFQITSNYEEYSRLTTELKNQLDWQASMVGAKREGRAEGHAEGLSKGLKEGREEGRAEGHAEGILEIARKMKTAGRPLSEIEEFTGLPPETIEQV